MNCVKCGIEMNRYCNAKYCFDCVEARKKEYRQRPEFKQRMKEYGKEYRQRNKQRIKQQRNKRRQLPEVKDRERKYRQKPEVKARRKEYMKEYQQTNKEKLKAKGKEYRQRLEVKARKKEYNKKYRQENEEKLKQHDKEYYYENRAERLRKANEYGRRPEVKVRANEMSRKRYQRPEVRVKKWEYEQKPEVKKRVNKLRRGRYNNDPSFKLMLNTYKAINKSIKHKVDGCFKRSDLISYSIEKLKEHLESQFTTEMTWNNHGVYWHIDHIIPVNYFVKRYKETKDMVYLKEAWRLDNLQPLSAKDNISKGGRITPEIQERINLMEQRLSMVGVVV